MHDAPSSEPIRPSLLSTDRLERLIDSISGVVFQCCQREDGSLSFSFLSSSCQQILELDADAVCADAGLLLKTICPESIGRFETSRAASADTLQPWEWEGLWRLASGRIKWLRWRAIPVRQDNSKIVWDGVMVDITVYVSAEGILQQAWEDAGRQDERRTRQLQQTLEQLQLMQFLVDRAPDAILWMDREARLSYANPSACRMFGYEAAELLTLSVYDLETHLSADAWQERWTHLQVEEVSSFQAVYRHKDGRMFPVEANLIRLQLGKRLECCAFVCDISERQAALRERTAAEQSMRESEAKFRSMVENANDIIYLLTPEGLFSYVAPNCDRFWGYHPTELQGTSYDRLVHPEDLPAYQKALAPPIEASQQQEEVEYRIRHKDGSWRWYASKLSTVRNSRGRVLSAIGIAHDITARVLAEQAQQKTNQDLERTLQKLQQTQAQLVQSEKMSSLGQMVAGIAHEINNPVGFIHGNLKHASDYIEDMLALLELYQRDFPQATPEIRACIEHIDLEFIREDLPKLLSSMEVGTTRIREIVRSLRNFSRLDEAERKPVDLHSGLDSTLMILGNRLKSTPQRPEIVAIKEYGDLPHIDCFAGQLNQVFASIFANAIDAIDEAWVEPSTQQPSDPPQIRIATEVLHCGDFQRAECVSIRIADNGLGMPESVRQRLFDPFFTTKPVGKGTGLGMSISYQIVTQTHGGKLYCTSELGRGSEFTIEIPIASEWGND